MLTRFCVLFALTGILGCSAASITRGFGCSAVSIPHGFDRSRATVPYDFGWDLTIQSTPVLLQVFSSNKRTYLHFSEVPRQVEIFLPEKKAPISFRQNGRFIELAKVVDVFTVRTTSGVIGAAKRAVPDFLHKECLGKSETKSAE